MPPRPPLAVTEDALRLIQHAVLEIPSQLDLGSPPAGRMLHSALGVPVSRDGWRLDAAVLRLVSIVESYVDAVSIDNMRVLLNPSQTVTLGKIFAQFEVDSTNNWQSRHDAFETYHGVKLKTRDGWGGIQAAIQLRNCLAHGLGNLTALQRGNTKLPATLAQIDVSVGSNRMYIGSTTVSVVGAAAQKFVRDVDLSLAIT